MILKRKSGPNYRKQSSICIFVKKAIRADVQTKIGNFVCSLLFRIAFITQKHPTPHRLLQKALQKNNDGETILPFVPQKNHAQF